ncbi:MAG TPA: glycosyltransferase 87 family protein [Streptosporangiaceae bacterium]|nr:glycosyltransferase 87 family protein [Streptosporangiaceae bacterium]
MLSLKAAPPRSAPVRRAAWLSPVSIPRYWAAAAFVLCACFAAGVALFSTNDLHRLWGLIAGCAYVAAAMAVLVWRSRGIDLALLLSVCGALITPMFWNAATGQRQPEVAVIARSAKQLVNDHSPYQSVASLATVHDPNAYNPYLPVMALFGVPRALFGSHVITDPRVWFGVAFLVIFWLALRAAGARNCARWTVFIAASPVIAFELAVGGTDVPILALMCLGFALLWRRPRFVLSGIALGLASAAKATAWPAVIVAAVLIGTRDGRRPVLIFLGSAVVSCAAIVAPVAALWPGALVDNTILFPLGLADVKSAAASPLPGHALADTGHIGHLIAVGLLVLAGAAIAISLVVRPPATVPAAVWRLSIGLALMFTLAPATRFGYFIYPASLLLWLGVAQLGQRQAAQLGQGQTGAGQPGPARAAPA